MTRLFHWAFSAAMIAALPSSALAAGWDGTWRGAWGGDAEQPTSITVAGNRVVSYTYQGISYPVPAGSVRVTATRITYEKQGVSVILTRTGGKTARATLHSGTNYTTAELKLH
ncbi:MAG: hypothetical protein E7774_09815 [Bradyrhizobium sp.]|nr:MAG: hypothetical protein E7774_09815 [Bradyrhizobium sp.]